MMKEATPDDVYSPTRIYSSRPGRKATRGLGAGRARTSGIRKDNRRGPSISRDFDERDGRLARDHVTCKYGPCQNRNLESCYTCHLAFCGSHWDRIESMTPEEKKNTNWEKCTRSLHTTSSTPEYAVPSPESPTVSDEDIPRRQPGNQRASLNFINGDRRKQDTGRQSLESNAMEGAAESIVVTPTNDRLSHSSFAKRTAASAIGGEDSHARKRPRAQTPPTKPLTQVISSPVILSLKPSSVSPLSNDGTTNSTNGAASRTNASNAAQRSSIPSSNSTLTPGSSSVATSVLGHTKNSTGRDTAADHKQAYQSLYASPFKSSANNSNNSNKNGSTTVNNSPSILKTIQCNAKPLEQPAITETTKVTPNTPPILGRPIANTQDQTNRQRAQDNTNTPRFANDQNIVTKQASSQSNPPALAQNPPSKPITSPDLSANTVDHPTISADQREIGRSNREPLVAGAPGTGMISMDLGAGTVNLKHIPASAPTRTSDPASGQATTSVESKLLVSGRSDANNVDHQSRKPTEPATLDANTMALLRGSAGLVAKNEVTRQAKPVQGAPTSATVVTQTQTPMPTQKTTPIRVPRPVSPAAFSASVIIPVSGLANTNVNSSNLTQQANGINKQVPLNIASHGLQSAPADPANGIQSGKSIRPQGPQSKTPVTNQEQNSSPRGSLVQDRSVSQSTPGQGPKKENPAANSSTSTPQADTPGSAAQSSNLDANHNAQARQDKSPGFLISQGYSRGQWQKDSMLIREILRASENSVLQEFIELLDDIDHTRLEGAEVYLTDNSFNRDLVTKAKHTIETHEWPIRHIEEFKSFLDRWRGGWCASRTTRKSTPVNRTPSAQKVTSPSSPSPGKLELSTSASQCPTTNNFLRTIEVDTQEEWQSWLDELSALKARLAKDNASLATRNEDNISKSRDVAMLSSRFADCIAILRQWDKPESKTNYNDKAKDENIFPNCEATVSQIESEVKKREEILNILQEDYKIIFQRVHTKLPAHIHSLEDKIRKYRSELENMLETHPRLRVAFDDVLEKLGGV